MKSKIRTSLSLLWIAVILVLVLQQAQGLAIAGGSSRFRLAPSTLRNEIPQHTSCRRPSTTSLSALPINQRVAKAAVSATAKLLASIGIGAWATKKPLDDQAVSALSRLTYWIFQPCFLFCSVSQTLAFSKKGGLPLSVLPVAALAQITLGTLVAKIVTRLLRFPENEARDVTISLTFANSGPLPLIFTDALFSSAPAVQSDVAACISFYLLMWSPLFWNGGRMILGTYGSSGNEETGLTRIQSEVGRLLSPPVVGCFTGILVGATPALRTIFFQGLGTPLFSAMKTLGTAYIPAALLVLAGSLVKPKSDEVEESSVSKKAILSILFSRFVLSPLSALLLVHFMGKFNMLSSARNKAIVTFVLLMEGCMPPAQNSVIMLQLDGLKQRATTMARLLTILYSIAVLPVTLLMSGCLALSHVMDFV